MKRIGKPKEGKEYPLIMRRDLVDIQKDREFQGRCWVKVPVYPKSTNVRVQVPYEQEEALNQSIRETKLEEMENGISS